MNSGSSSTKHTGSFPPAAIQPSDPIPEEIDTDDDIPESPPMEYQSDVDGEKVQEDIEGDEEMEIEERSDDSEPDSEDYEFVSEDDKSDEGKKNVTQEQKALRCIHTPFEFCISVQSAISRVNQRKKLESTQTQSRSN